MKKGCIRTDCIWYKIPRIKGTYLWICDKCEKYKERSKKVSQKLIDDF